eukprot:SAG25_NODE_309_length_10042_cov_25.194609_11_plen_75_part_00
MRSVNENLCVCCVHSLCAQLPDRAVCDTIRILLLIVLRVARTAPIHVRHKFIQAVATARQPAETLLSHPCRAAV